MHVVIFVNLQDTPLRTLGSSRSMSNDSGSSMNNESTQRVTRSATRHMLLHFSPVPTDPQTFAMNSDGRLDHTDAWVPTVAGQGEKETETETETPQTSSARSGLRERRSFKGSRKLF